VLDDGVRPGKEQALVSTVLPLDPVGRAALVAFDGEDQCPPLWLTNTMTQYNDAVSDCSTHVT